MSPALSVHFLQTQSDSRLLALARGGHERAFEALVHRYRKSLLAYCRRLLLPEGRAEDAVQQALMQAWIALERGDQVRDARAWLFRIAHNAALNSLRGSRYDYAQLSESLAGERAPEEDLDRRIAIREALAGLAALPPLQREALLRTAVEGRPHEEVAAAMGLSDGALRGLVYRARATLRSAVTAITPPSLVAWVASAGAHGGSFAQRVPEVSAASGGSAGVAALLLKGGTVAVTAGVLVVGASAVHHVASPHRHAKPVSRISTTDTLRPADARSEALAADRRRAGLDEARARGNARGSGADRGLARGRLEHARTGDRPPRRSDGAGRDPGSHDGGGGVLGEHGNTTLSGDHHGGDHGTQSPTGSHDGGTSGGTGTSGTSDGHDGGGLSAGSTSGTSGSGSGSGSTTGGSSGSGGTGGDATLTTSTDSHDGGLTGSTDGGSLPH